MEEVYIEPGSAKAVVMMRVTRFMPSDESVRPFFDAVIDALSQDGYVFQGDNYYFDPLSTETECERFERYCNEREIEFEIVKGFSLPITKEYALERLKKSGLDLGEEAVALLLKESLELAKELVERTILTNSIGKVTPRASVKSSSGSIPLEWRASGVEDVCRQCGGDVR